jgi:hypothetical protein
MGHAACVNLGKFCEDALAQHPERAPQLLLIYADALTTPSIHPSISLLLVDVATAQDTGTFEMDNGIAYGYSSMQGWRKQHEDAHCADRDDDSGLR